MKLDFPTNAWPHSNRRVFAKLLRIMKLTTFFMLVACLCTRAEGHAQRISLSLQNASIEKVFKSITDQTGYNFVYTNKVIANAKPVNVKVSNASIEEVLDVCLQGQMLTYTIFEKTVVIKLKKDPAKTETLVLAKTAPPPIEVKGRMTNDKGEPLDGVSVKLRGSSVGTSTGY